MRCLFLVFIIFLILVPLEAGARGAVIVIIDSLGSSYISPNVACYTDGIGIPSVGLESADRADASFQLKVPVPATEYGHAVIVTGFSGASQQTVGYYNATIFDALRGQGYIALGILENGDSAEMLSKLDAVVREKNDSIYDPFFEYVQNGRNVPADVVQFMKNYPVLQSSKAGKDKYAPYIRYNNWSLDFTYGLITYMNKYEPGIDYILIVNAGGLDHSGHNTGANGYRTVLSALDPELGKLIDACEASGTILMVTGDHGMSFDEDSLKGSHAGPDVSMRNESLLTPLFIYSNKTLKGNGGVYGQECLSPTLLSLLDEPNTMSLSDGYPLPVKERPAIFLKSDSLVNVTVSGYHYSASATFSGVHGFKGLAKGEYTISYGGMQKDIRLDHDEMIDLSKGWDHESQSLPAIPAWAIYLFVAVVSIAAIGVALKLAWMRR